MQTCRKDEFSEIIIVKSTIPFLATRNTPITLKYKLRSCYSGCNISANSSIKLPIINYNSRLYSLALSRVKYVGQRLSIQIVSQNTLNLVELSFFEECKLEHSALHAESVWQGPV